MKRFGLILYAPFVLAFLVLSAALIRQNQNFYFWYRSQIKKWSRHILRVLGIEISISDESRKIFDASRNAVLVANHRSHLDSIILWAMCAADKHLVFAAKKELFHVPLLGAGLRQAKAISVDRSKGRLALTTLINETKKLDSNEILVVFPEGTRGEAKLLKFKRGAFTVALESHRGILPVCIKGTDNLFSKGKLFPSKGKAYIKVCDAIPYGDIKGFVDIELANHVRERMHSAYFSEEQFD